MRLDFRRVPHNVIADDMRAICRERGVELTDDAARLLAGCADGSVRDGLSILDQVLAGGDKLIDRDKVLEYVGTTGEEFFLELTELVSRKKTAEAMVLLNGVLLEGKDVRQIMKDWVAHYRGLLISKFVRDAGDMLNMSAENLQKLAEQSRQISLEEIDYAVSRLSRTINEARWSTNPRVLLELAIVAISMGGEREAAPPRRQPRPVRTQAEPATAETAIQPEPAAAETQAAEEAAPQAGPAALEEKTAAEGKGEYERLWHRIFEEGEGSAGSFNLIRSGTTLEAITGDSFIVEACSSFTRRYVEQKKAQLEKLMEEQTGKKLHLICRLREERQEVQEAAKTAEELAREASSLLGIDVDIE